MIANKSKYTAPAKKVQNVDWNIKLWHGDSKKYEDLGVFVTAPTRSEAIELFREETRWIDKSNTMLVAVPPLCR